MERISREDLVWWRRICAQLEVAQSNACDLTKRDVEVAWHAYYEAIEWLHEKYEIDPEDRTKVNVSAGTGLIVYED